MDRMLSIPDGLASDVTGFAATHDVPEDRAYELLVSVGLATLDGHDITVTVEGDRLILECPACGRAFDAPDEFVDHDHDE
jgi:hypothetical protein